MTPTLAERFAQYAAKLRFSDLPDAVVHEVKRRVIDSFATAVGAMDAEAYAIAKRCALRVQSDRTATLFGGGTSERRMGDVRQRPADPLPRLQRHLSVAGAGPPERQPRPGLGGRRERRREWQADYHSRGSGVRNSMPALRRRQPSQAQGVDHVTYGAISSALAAGKLMELECDADHARGRHCRRLQRRPAANPVRRAEHVEGLRVRQRRPQRRRSRPCWRPKG